MFAKLNVFAKQKASHSLLITGAVCTALFVVLMLFVARIPGTDDEVFPKQIEPYKTVLDWISYRYESWSGRIFAEGFVYIFSTLPLVIWKLVTTGLFVTYLYYGFMFYRLWQKQADKHTDTFMLIAIASFPLLMQVNTLMDGLFWPTGAMNYFWILVLGIVALYPPTHAIVVNKFPHPVLTTLGLIATVIAASSQEQTGAVLVTLYLIFSVYWYVTHKKLVISTTGIALALFVVTALTAFAIGMSAPGNEVRFEKELRWIPDFTEVSTIDRLEYSARWFMEATINHTGILLVVLWLIMGILLLLKKKTRIAQIIGSVFIIAATFLLLKGNLASDYFFNFYATWNWHPIPGRSIFALVPWFGALVLSAVAPLILYKRQPKGYVLALLITGALAATAIVTLSPTMYISGWRVLFVPSVILIFANIFLLSDLLQIKKGQWKTIAIVLFIAVSLLSYLFILIHFMDNFSNLLLKP